MARNAFWIMFGVVFTVVLLNFLGIGPDRLAEVINLDAASEIFTEAKDKLKDVPKKKN